MQANILQRTEIDLDCQRVNQDKEIDPRSIRFAPNGPRRTATITSNALVAPLSLRRMLKQYGTSEMFSRITGRDVAQTLASIRSRSFVTFENYLRSGRVQDFSYDENKRGQAKHW